MKIKNLFFAAIGIVGIMLVGCGDKMGEKEGVSVKPSPDQVAISGFGASEPTISYDSISQLKEESESIIYGEVKSFQYEIENGSAYTIETVEVLDSFQGDIEKGTEIQIYRTGGYVTLEEYINSFGEESKDEVRNMIMFQEYSDDDLKEKYMKQFSEGEADTDVGSKAIYFLRYGEVRENVYNRVGRWEGEYVELANGDYKIPGPESYEEMNRVLTADGDDLEEYESCMISWDELMQEIND